MKAPATGALLSAQDPRTVQHDEVVTLAAPLVKGGIEYAPDDHEHQHYVGICTAISLVQNREKANGKKYSSDFQYLLQKKYYDGNWYEGSSIFNALKVGKDIGFLPLDQWTYTTEDDRYLPYSQYVAKLQAIPDLEVLRLTHLCVDKIPGYAAVKVEDPQALAHAINDSEAGILCMYGCGDTWWLPSWLPSAINPLRRPYPYTSAHAIGMTLFDYTSKLMQKLANTWGKTWGDNGNADINHSTYSPIEAWSILRFTPVIPPFIFTRNLYPGMKNLDVQQLQKRLGVIQTGFYGTLTFSAVRKYQKDHGIPSTGFVGEMTRKALNG